MKKNNSPISAQLVISTVIVLLVGLLAIFLLRLLTVWMKGSGVWSVLLPIALAGAMALIGYIFGASSDRSRLSYAMVVVLVVMCQLSWYWWDYRDFRTQLANRPVASQLEGTSDNADKFLVAEGFSPGFWGYLKWSAFQGATFEDAEEMPAGNRAAIVNWAKRIISLFWALVWAFLAFEHAD